MEIALRFLRYSEKIARAYSAIAQNSTLWKSTFSHLLEYKFRHNFNNIQLIHSAYVELTV